MPSRGGNNITFPFHCNNGMIFHIPCRSSEVQTPTQRNRESGSSVNSPDFQLRYEQCG